MARPMTNAEQQPEYNEEIVEYLQLFRGEGFLSPGGAEETRRVLDRVEVQSKAVLEIGSGLGGCCIILAGERGASSVLGIDIEPVVIHHAKQLVEQAGLSDRVRFQQVEPGPLPVANGTFDLVFSKDAMCHIEDKAALYNELFRVLKPGGRVAVGDWLCDKDGPYSPAMTTFIKTTGLSFFLDSLEGVKHKLQAAGFVDVQVVNRNAWFREEARNEAKLLEGPLADKVEALRGKAATDSSNECQHHMITVLDNGEFCPSHFYATKPF